ncbi:hypothetical protein [Pseudobacteriovorax antillogorgiicola]|uniref:Lipoprotein n=1 Tax=Pseudobacteriovorax antillogorgiicola TaxID=1513793 RepID=A0A1Y6BFR8_9BACT|nr:hypothetical protein [Pseudobacteriovorax antillogorgiicola]TCS57350.1 hypothetical protein EDD56_10390 [Pseudobacteriovorax antillogorgiicola]SMF02121.1 hypothetical protein SAMN06296036_103243 [Pseudobacteriovorax antillogorgiicola]
MIKHFSRLALLLAPVACSSDYSSLDATNEFQGKTVDHYYQPFTMSADETIDTFQEYILDNDVLASDSQERILPTELQGLFFLDGAPLPDKTLSLKHARPMNENASRIRWSVSYKTTFSWLNTEKGHGIYSKALSYQPEYELEWRDCTDEVMADMEKQFAKFKVSEKPIRCTAADRRYAVINAYSWQEGERIPLPEDILYFDMYLIPKNSERDYYIWHRRSKICNNNDSSSIRTVCNIFRSLTGRNDGDGYSRYQFTQVIDPNGRRTSAYNKGLVPEVIEAAGDTDNIFFICDPSDINGNEECLDGTEMLPPIEDREVEVIEDEKEKELSFLERLTRSRKIASYLWRVAGDLIQLQLDK